MFEAIPLPPGTLLVLGALVCPLLKGPIRQAWILLLPVLSGWHLYTLAPATTVQWGAFGGFELMPIRVDGLSLVWGTIFHIAAFLSALFALRDERPGQHLAGLMYAGSAIGGVFAGDLLTLFVYWELTAITSVFLIWAPHDYLEGEEKELQRRRSYRAGMRYLVIQVGSGVILLAGLVTRQASGQSLAFEKMDLAEPASMLIFLAFGIKAAFPFLHNWLQDAYPEATPSGTVFLSAFTTKMAIYALARGFPGTEALIWIGVAMTAFPIFFAVIENDLRRVLAYSLNNQLGFMIVGVGLGTEMALNGTAAHAFAHILYKALLFMSVGAVLMRTGTAKGSELGGLYKSMPWTTGFCIVGAASISAFPLTSGFVSKSLILSAAAEEHLLIPWLVLLFASAGVFHHSGIKIPFFAFFGHDSGKRVPEAPFHMLLAMGITAALCLLVGIFPAQLYALLPFEVDYEPYTSFHVVSQLQLLFFSALAFTLLNRFGLYPPELRSTVLDFDWIYRRPLPRLARAVGGGTMAVWNGGLAVAQGFLDGASRWSEHLFGIRGLFARTWQVGSIILCVVVMLWIYLMVSFLVF